MAADSEEMCEEMPGPWSAVPGNIRHEVDRRATGHLHTVGGGREPERVPIAQLKGTDSPRLEGTDQAHVLRLMEAGDDLPPILVHRQTMRIIDGVHRVRAAICRGRAEIDAIFYEGSTDSAFVLAVETNVRHGLPLSLNDRRAAAARIIAICPAWSDRMIATVTGLSARTVSSLRACANEENAQLNMRVGADGRLRPVTTAASRRLAAEMITANPEASLRQIAKVAGISPGTVRDVRERLRRGEDPVLPRRSGKTERREVERVDPQDKSPVDVSQMLQILGKDPSLRLNATGRELLRWLHLHAVDLDACTEIIESAPDHCAGVMAELARGCAHSWSEISMKLAKRLPD